MHVIGRHHLQRKAALERLKLQEGLRGLVGREGHGRSTRVPPAGVVLQVALQKHMHGLSGCVDVHPIILQQRMHRHVGCLVVLPIAQQQHTHKTHEFWKRDTLWQGMRRLDA
eukprot:1146616-Pelagomonas_calceolata.AAC.4